MEKEKMMEEEMIELRDDFAFSFLFGVDHKNCMPAGAFYTWTWKKDHTQTQS